MAGYGPVEDLTREHDRSEFDCGSEPVSAWLRERARSAQASGTGRVRVITPNASLRVAGFYALAASSVLPDKAPGDVAKGISKYLPIPVILLAQLGVDRRDKGHGLGRTLMRDVMTRVASTADNVGVRALLIDAESEAALAFYMHLAEFLPSPLDPLQLFLPLDELRQIVNEAEPD